MQVSEDMWLCKIIYTNLSRNEGLQSVGTLVNEKIKHCPSYSPSSLSLSDTESRDVLAQST